MEESQVLDFAFDIGEALLKNGAEISRVEETITRIHRHFTVKDVGIFVLSNGIFMTAGQGGKPIYSKVKHIPLSGFNLDTVDAVNNLSRMVCSGSLTLEEAQAKLTQISRPIKRNQLFGVAMAGIGSGGFCHILGGGLAESLLTLPIAALLYVLVLYCIKIKTHKLTLNILGGAFITLLSVVAFYLFPTISMDKVIIGSILPLVPGVALVNSICDIANSDIISGLVRLMDSLLVFMYIAIGVGVTLALFNSMAGGILL